jgi:hypothetical protein
MGNLTDTETSLLRYLLGQLSETEQSSVEERFITDPEANALLCEVENDLIADYVRGRLAPGERERFERHYMATAANRQRVQVADLLLRWIDQEETTQHGIAPMFESMSWRQRSTTQMRSYRWVVGLIAVAGALLIVLGGGWLVKGARQQRNEANLARLESMRREIKLLREIDDAKQRNFELEGEIEQLRRRLYPPVTKSPIVSAFPEVIKYVMVDGTLRGKDVSVTSPLVILSETEKVQLIYTMEDSGYPCYRADIQSAGGEKVWSSESISPRLSRSVATFTITLLASKLANGAYTLSLSGVSKTGDIDHLSKHSFRVERR